MNQLKEKANVVMLPTEKASFLCTRTTTTPHHKDWVAGSLAYMKYDDIPDPDKYWQHQHLHICIIKKIEQNDLFIANQKVHKCIRVDNNTICPYITLNDKGVEIGHFQTWSQVVISSTDSSLGLPLVPDGFVKKYVHLQGNIKQVMVDMIEIDGFPDEMKTIKDLRVVKHIVPKTDKNNYVTITKVLENIPVKGLSHAFAVWCWEREILSDITKLEELFDDFLNETYLK